MIDVNAPPRQERDGVDDDTRLGEAIKDWKWRQIRDPIIPEPQYEQQVEYSCGESIRQKFREKGIQVIVKMATIELTPEKPDFPTGGWHVRTHRC